MKTKLMYCNLIVASLFAMSVQAQVVYHIEQPPTASIGTSWSEAIELPVVACVAEPYSEKGNEPGYDAYKKGYDYILDEEWEDAIKQLRKMIAEYPKSQYVDDATYWIAYAYKDLDEDKAVELDKDFIKKYPKSSYYDDAVADLSELGGNFTITVSGDSQHVAISRSHGGFTFATGPSIARAREQLHSTQRMMAPNAIAIGRTPLPALMTGYGSRSYDKLDEETQLQLDALNALGDKRDDEGSFDALKEVAVDAKRNRTLRVSAMDQLAEFKKPDPLPVFIEIAKRDTSEDIQNMAIDYIGSLSGNKNRSVETLSELFTVIPKYRLSQLRTVLSSIAEIGNDKSVDFLGTVARNNENYDLRRDAVYYLGGIGNEKARAVLLDILKTKKQK